ncbi:MAG: YigZ family protein [Candidatus Sumerlaeia bacterium]|nr:YigZ family protein [Candidatus Sumerlaeia bacterium]
MSGYPVPRRRVRVEHRQSNSRFIATLDRASTVEEAREQLRHVREEMPDASHHVHAMKVGHGASVIEGTSDDGEPAGTSGPPMLAVLRGSDIGDAILVVTRYFGGTKLGTGGLVQAYSEAARLALAAVETELKVDRVPISFSIPYTFYDRVKILLETGGAIIEGEDFSDVVSVDALFPVEGLGDFGEQLRELTAGSVSIIRRDEAGDPSAG